MSEPVVYGDPISTYVRSVRLALAEKGVQHSLVAVDLVKGQHKEAGHIARNPWGKMPAFEHAGQRFYDPSGVVHRDRHPHATVPRTNDVFAALSTYHA